MVNGPFLCVVNCKGILPVIYIDAYNSCKQIAVLAYVIS